MKRPALLATLAVASLIGAACGGDDDGSADTEAPPATEASVETDAPVETEVPVDTEAPPATEAPPVSEPEDVPAGPERVVSLSPTHTEMVFAIGAALGFTLVMVLFGAMREQLVDADIPRPFRGAPIALISAGIMSLAFMGFQGMAGS